MSRMSKSRLFAQSLQQKIPPLQPTIFIKDADPFIPEKLVKSLKPEIIKEPTKSRPKQTKTEKPKFNSRNQELLRELLESDFSFLNISLKHVEFGLKTRVIYNGNTINSEMAKVISKRYKELVRGAARLEFVKDNEIESLLDQIEHNLNG